MKKFFIYLLVFGLLFFVFDKIFLFFINISPSKEVDKRLELVLTGKINKDVIILGSSKSSRDIIASQLEKEIHHSVYNLSYPGSNIEFHEFLLRALTTFNKSPKMVILTVDNPIEFLPDSLINFRLDRLYPLVKYDYVSEELVDRNEKNALLSKLFVLHRMTKANFDIRQKKFTALDSLLYDGSMPISFQKTNEDWNKTVNNVSYPIKNETKVKQDCFYKIIAICKQKNIKLFLISPPMYKGVNPEFKKRMIELTGTNANFYEYNTTNPTYKDKRYYFDLNHLNKNGAFIFTTEIATYLKSFNK
ncbi:hypothetical protein [Flavobacterium sp.]|uniref:hypothetical protein n=1 Tax=Flavobacterium sp. TaxID=239 RepID=UPI0025D75628|nr:hypothetical protein [Flavobacterium sp.]